MPDISSVINTKYDNKQNVPCSQKAKTQSKVPFPCKNSQILWSSVSISDTQSNVLGLLKLLMVGFISVYQNTYIWTVCRYLLSLLKPVLLLLPQKFRPVNSLICKAF